MEGGDLLPLLRKLQSIADPTEAEHRALAELRPTIKLLDAQEDIVREGDRPSIVCLILEGFACRYATRAVGPAADPVASYSRRHSRSPESVHQGDGSQPRHPGADQGGADRA